LEKAVGVDEKFAPAFLHLGIVRSDLGDSDGSIKALQAALKLRGDWPIALNELGVTYFRMQKYEEAVEQFKKATEVDKQYMKGFINIARAEFKRGRMKEARKAQDKVRELDPREASKLDLYFKGVDIY
jgi:tetratricopeptide (TPR) repeat protein